MPDKQDFVPLAGYEEDQDRVLRRIIARSPAFPMYRPSRYMTQRRILGRLHKCPGLAQLIGAAQAAGIQVAIDMGNGGDHGDFEAITPATCLMAVQEMEEAQLVFVNGKQRAGMLVIAENGDDWLCDYHTAPWLEAIIQECKL